VRWRVVIAVGLFIGVGQFGVLFVAMNTGLLAGLASVIAPLQPVFTIPLAVVALGERPSLRQVAGVSLAIAGLIAIALGRAREVPLGAVVLGVASAASWGVEKPFRISARGLRVKGAQIRIHAARVYSWMRPPRRSRRSMVAVGCGREWSLRAVGFGGARFSERAFTKEREEVKGANIGVAVVGRAGLGGSAAWRGVHLFDRSCKSAESANAVEFFATPRPRLHTRGIAGSIPAAPTPKSLQKGRISPGRRNTPCPMWPGAKSVQNRRCGLEADASAGFRAW
jgi:hypothetical protein